MEPLPSTFISPQDAQEMKEWAGAYGTAVRQRTVRQETTMSRAGTLPDYLYQRQVEPGEPVAIDDMGKGLEEEVEEEIDEGEEIVHEDVGEDEVEYDTSNDE